jgi:hypothetical protein
LGEVGGVTGVVPDPVAAKAVDRAALTSSGLCMCVGVCAMWQCANSLLRDGATNEQAVHASDEGERGARWCDRAVCGVWPSVCRRRLRIWRARLPGCDVWNGPLGDGGNMRLSGCSAAKVWQAVTGVALSPSDCPAWRHG